MAVAYSIEPAALGGTADAPTLGEEARFPKLKEISAGKDHDRGGGPSTLNTRRMQMPVTVIEFQHYIV